MRQHARREPVPSAAMTEMLTDRALNRALLARQMLLEREDRSAVDTIGHLVGMQAQNPTDPYYALWARIEDFTPADLETLLTGREAVRCWTLRRTVHLVTSRDARALLPLTASVGRRTYRSSVARHMTEVDIDVFTNLVRELAESRPRARPDLGRALHEHWPGVDVASLGYAATMLLPLVQLPPRGLWSENGAAVLTTAEAWLGGELDPDPSPDDVVLRYLAAFGPASNPDIRTWSGLTGIQEVTKRLQRRLRMFKDPNGRTLYDLEDAPLPDPGTPAPPRFLPELDNVFLSHDNRSRIIGAEVGWVGRITVERAMRKLLVDGFVNGEWAVDASDGGDMSILTVRPYRKLTTTEVEEITDEGARLLGLIAPDATPDFRFTEPRPPERARSWNPE